MESQVTKAASVLWTMKITYIFSVRLVFWEQVKENLIIVVSVLTTAVGHVVCVWIYLNLYA